MPTTDDNFEDFTFDDFYNPEEDAEFRGKYRKIVIENGNEIRVESVDPFGWWVVSLKRGKLPDYIKDNNYTTFRDALRDINRWMREREYKLVYAVSKDKTKKEG